MRWQRQRDTCKRILEEHPLIGQLVHMGCTNVGVPITGQMVGAQRIHADQDNVQALRPSAEKTYRHRCQTAGYYDKDKPLPLHDHQSIL